ncbi:MAG: hypothetical protein CBD16_02525 [Betaproteobacteria bacterium TMED156]|nr:MAG: hypothetical protein CBD16_02525 [Betaproteobacteria bacterium TMED156]
MEEIISEFKKKFKDFSNHSSRENLETQIKLFISTTLNKLDVVSKEDFEKQKKTLEKAQSKLKDLEKKLDELLKKNQ